MPTNTYSVTVTKASGVITVSPQPVAVQANNVGDLVVVTFHPGTDTQITGIAGLPTNVSVSGPDTEGRWTASYTAAAVESVWTYFVAAFNPSAGRKSHDSVHDPEIDNTPPPQGP
jgi:hypothetical protein